MSSTPPTSPDPNRPPRPAPVVPDYELERLIGRGSYGEVWLAHTALGARRAVKVVYRDSFDSERPYLREFAGIRAYEPISSHESQVSVFHVGKNDEAGYFYYVMELADDAATLAKPFPPLPTSEPPASPPAYAPATLAVLLKQRGRLPCAEALPLARSLASALDRLHGHGLVHRDIKPANIIFVDGRPKLADIGLVTSAAKADTLVGTTGYIPPEGPGTAAADLFSFGKVLYEVVTGHDRQEFPMLPDDLGQLPDREQLLEVNEIILKCCHLDPRERYASGAEVLTDLKRIEAGHSLRHERARRWQLAVSGCVVLAVLGGLGVLHIREQSHRTQPPGASAFKTQSGAGARSSASDSRWTNSLGMVFVRIPGVAVEFSIWETRAQDFRLFATETQHKASTGRSSVPGSTNLLAWDTVGGGPEPDQPVRVVTWEDAKAFCDWLTRKEQQAGLLEPGEHYRLPTDWEWSTATGLTNETGVTPMERHLAGTNSNILYWGTNWPPPPGAGNFSDENSVMVRHIAGYHDPFPSVAPVGSFPPERHGLFDIAGNVAEWCEDRLFDVTTMSHLQVARGAAYENTGQSAFRVTRRILVRPREPAAPIGFRVVRVPATGPAVLPVATVWSGTNSTSLPGAGWANTLGMVFVPIPGLTAEFCIWETRVQDFRVFVEATGHKADSAHFFEVGNPRKIPRNWDDPPVSSDPAFPVRAVSGRDARAFCEWLTVRERAAGRLGTTRLYRLPRDAEWSWVAGVTNEVRGSSAKRPRATASPAEYHWGTNWPPPPDFGNFAGEESPFVRAARLSGYQDAYPTAAPVGSFAAGRNGLFDLAGNVSELCEEWPATATDRLVVRGAAWDSFLKKSFEVKNRRNVGPQDASIYFGFRVVCALVDDDRPPGK